MRYFAIKPSWQALLILARKLSVMIVFLFSSCWLSVSHAQGLPSGANLQFELALPAIKTSQYNRPYVAVWVEDSERNVVRTVSLWLGKDEWHKDLRSWWRKAGRYAHPWIDGVTGATKPAGKYKFDWNLQDDQQQPIAAGDYVVHIEVVREHGGRDYLKQPITFGQDAVAHHLAPTAETGVITLTYQP